MTSERAAVLEAARQAIALDPTRKAFLAGLYFPQRIRGAENDLASLYDDPELTALLR